jgi:hypothetical protein
VGNGHTTQPQRGRAGGEHGTQDLDEDDVPALPPPKRDIDGDERQRAEQQRRAAERARERRDERHRTQSEEAGRDESWCGSERHGALEGDDAAHEAEDEQHAMDVTQTRGGHWRREVEEQESGVQAGE